MFIKGAQIGPSFKNLAEQRFDIFGSEETVIGRKVHILVNVKIVNFKKENRDPEKST